MELNRQIAKRCKEELDQGRLEYIYNMPAHDEDEYDRLRGFSYYD